MNYRGITLRPCSHAAHADPFVKTDAFAAVDCLLIALTTDDDATAADYTERCITWAKTALRRARY